MSNEDRRRESAWPGAHPASAWSLLSLHANHRMAELLEEAERARIASRARSGRHTASEPRRPVARPWLLRSALSALAVVARRLAIPRPGSQAG
jgi:hypothetical protein